MWAVLPLLPAHVAQAVHWGMNPAAAGAGLDSAGHIHLPGLAGNSTDRGVCL